MLHLIFAVVIDHKSFCCNLRVSILFKYSKICWNTHAASHIKQGSMPITFASRDSKITRTSRSTKWSKLEAYYDARRPGIRLLSEKNGIPGLCFSCVVKAKSACAWLFLASTPSVAGTIVYRKAEWVKGHSSGYLHRPGLQLLHVIILILRNFFLCCG